MFRIDFTSHVLGKEAAEKLRRQEVTQTVRGKRDTIVVALSRGELKPGDPVEIFLDGERLGEAEFTRWEWRTANELYPDDARRGGFAGRLELLAAMRRAGFRFKALKDYEVYRIQFRWLVVA